MASMTDFVSCEDAIAGAVVVKDLWGDMKEEENEFARGVCCVDCRIEENAATLLLYLLPPPAPCTTFLATSRSTCAIESTSRSGVVLVWVARWNCIGTWMWGVNCCRRRARITPSTRPVSSVRIAVVGLDMGV